MRPYLLFILACACALAAALGARAADDPAPTPAALDTNPPPAPPQPDLTDREVLKAIARYRRVTWHWQRVMGHPVMRKLKHTPPALEDRLPAWRRVAKRTVAT